MQFTEASQNARISQRQFSTSTFYHIHNTKQFRSHFVATNMDTQYTGHVTNCKQYIPTKLTYTSHIKQA